ncbi:MAG TPA: glycosyltransferase family 4 protein, partial [Myxococcaceae bacterium]|nr:glycosyltransferase family 4 protein [Myxococcaceae bacterium]
MKVLMTADTVGGVWIYAVELARALGGEGVGVALATQGAPLTEDQRRQVRGLDHVELFESAYKLEWMDDPWDDVARCSGWLLELASRVKPDVVHLNQYAYGGLPFRAPTLVVGHSCVLSWWEACRKDFPPASWERYRQEVAHGLSTADAVVAPSGAMLSALRRHYGPLPDARVILNGRDPSERSPAPKEPLVLSAGRLWDAAKNVAALEDVAPRLPWAVVVAGDGRETGEGAPRPGKVHPLGKVPPRALAGWFSRAAIYALPARYEPFGLSVLEAAQAGCALVLGDIASQRELWDGAAVFVPPDDHAALEAALHALI